jgi:hypothetical protein
MGLAEANAFARTEITSRCSQEWDAPAPRLLLQRNSCVPDAGMTTSSAGGSQRPDER